VAAGGDAVKREIVEPEVFFQNPGKDRKRRSVSEENVAANATDGVKTQAQMSGPL
jgi:hypothetical protein